MGVGGIFILEDEKCVVHECLACAARGTDIISPSIGGTGVSPVQAQAKACGYHKLPFDCNFV